MWRETKYADLHKIRIPVNNDMLSILVDSPATDDLLRDNARTWWEQDDILAIVGVAPLWKGVGTVWTLLTDDARKRGVVLTRGVIRFITMLETSWGYRRLQATVAHHDEPARLWIVQLGFHYEGTMTAYGPDRTTHDMYARLRD